LAAASTMNLPRGGAISSTASGFDRAEDAVRVVGADGSDYEGDDCDDDDDCQDHQERRAFLAEAGEVFEELVVPRRVEQGGVDLVPVVPVHDRESGHVVPVVEPFRPAV